MESFSETNRDEDKGIPAKSDRARGVCLFVIMGALVCLVCMIAGAVLFSYWWKRNDTRNVARSETQVFVLDKEMICELAFVQQTFVVETKSDFPWALPIPLTDKEFEIGRATVKVKGIYLAKYGVDQKGIGDWQFYPDTRELHITTPDFKVIGVETLFKEIDSESESLLKKLSTAERNKVIALNQEDAIAQATSTIQTDKPLRQSCIDQLKKLLSSFGIQLVLVDPIRVSE